MKTVMKDACLGNYDGLKTLEGKCIVIGICGSIAAVEDIKLIRALRRRGAEVFAVMSQAACGIVTPDAVEYACDEEVITKITGMVEHVKFCGIGGHADVLLIAPATANTICKAAAGIDDTPVTTFITTAIGRKMPVIMVPAMHESMYSHPAFAEAAAKLKSWGVTFVSPQMSENKAKAADASDIIAEVEKACTPQVLAGKKVVITAGACREKIDDVRIMTTSSSGKMGLALAREAFRMGADVAVVHNASVPDVYGAKNIIIESASEMMNAVLSEVKNGCDYYLSAAAVSDYSPVITEGKIESGQENLTIALKPLPKILDAVLESAKGAKIAAFKLDGDMEGKPKKMLEKGISVVCANGAGNLGTDDGSYILHTKSESTPVSGSKEETAREIWKKLL